MIRLDGHTQECRNSGLTACSCEGSQQKTVKQSRAEYDALIHAPEYDAATAEDLAKTMHRLDRKDLARDQNVKRANGPSAVEVAMVAAPIYGPLVKANALAGEPLSPEKMQRSTVRSALKLIAEAERQLNEGGE